MSRSQAITTFGVGSIYELRTFRKSGSRLDSVMIAGLDDWDASLLTPISEPMLERLLQVRHFRLPPVKTNQWTDIGDNGPAIPAVRFPRWLVCEKCNRLGTVGQQFQDSNNGPRCGAQNCNGRGVPVRLVVTCYHREKDGGEDPQPGHIDDFPWSWWVHSRCEDRHEKCDRPQLKLETRKGSVGLAGLEVVCHSSVCQGKTRRSLEGVFGDQALVGYRCKGKRPWLRDYEDNCTRPVRALLRGASNIHFPVLASALSIPPGSDRLWQLLATNCRALIDNVGKKELHELIEMARNSVPILRREAWSDADISEALQVLAGGEPQEPMPKTTEELRERERSALLRGRKGEDAGEFEAESLPTAEVATIGDGMLDALVQVHRLREVRALRGFQRVNPAWGGDALTVRYAPLSKQPQNQDWLPAIEVRGEGIYFELAQERLLEWEQRDAVQQRWQLLRKNHAAMCAARQLSPDLQPAPPARLVLVHTLLHLLLKQFALECGYSGASLRERLYVSEDWAGGLLYTATTGADGTLGGLVSQGHPDRFDALLRAAVINAGWCSSDPLCMESRGQGADALNLAACHACALVSETSCEQRNLFLDRALVVGLPGQPDTGFLAALAIDSH